MDYDTDTDTDIESPPIHKQRDGMGMKQAVLKDFVIPYLPAKSIIRFSAVAKEWYNGIKHPFMSFRQSCDFKSLSGFFCQVGGRDPTFVSLNGPAYGVPIPNLGFLPEPVDIVSSCSGLLVCHGCGDEELYYVCNPATTEWTTLPEPQLYHVFGSGHVLAFEPSAMNIEGDYELICAVPMFDHLYFEIYSSRTKLWKIIDTIVVDMEDLAIKHNSFYMNGVAYWLTNTKKVISFVLEKEVYEVIPLPSEIQDCPYGVLTQLGGELCYITMSHLWGNTFYIMINGGRDMSLKRHLEVNIGDEGTIFPQYKVLPSLDGEKVMIQLGVFIYSYSIHDHVLERVTRVEIGPASARIKHLPYVNSLVQFTL